jgi:uncharacterized protein
MNFKEIDINSKKILDPFFEKVSHEACEYCFTTLFMWQHMYKTYYLVEEDFAIVVGEYGGNKFTVIPLASKENLPKAFEFILNYFKEHNMKFNLRAVTEEVVEFLKEKYPNKYKYIEERDYFDYVYLGEDLRTLGGRKNQKKRNHINAFKKEYEGRYEYKALEEDNLDECIQVLRKWNKDKEEHDVVEEGMDEEFIAIKKIFNNYDELKDTIKIGGIYIDGQLEAFTFGEYLNPNMAVIHVEKANPNIRGLYPIINQLFLQNEFPDVEFVNREEDMGIEGLRKAKLSYHPYKFAEKYTVLED